MKTYFESIKLFSIRGAFILLCLMIGFSVLFKANAFDGRLEEGELAPEALEIVSSAFAFDPYSKANYDPFIKLKVFNASEHIVNRAVLQVLVKCDEGKEILFKERFAYFANGGLKPNSASVWLLNPVKSSFWALHNIPYDAEIEVKVLKLQCPKKNSPWQHEFEFKFPKRHDYLN